MSLPKHKKILLAALTTLPGSPRLLPITTIMGAALLCRPTHARAQNPIDPTQEFTRTSAQILTETTDALFAILNSVLMIYLVPLLIILSLLTWSILRRRQQNLLTNPSSMPPKLETPQKPPAQTPPTSPKTQKPKLPPPPPIHPHQPDPSQSTSAQPDAATPESSTAAPDTTTEAIFSIHPHSPRQQQRPHQLCPRCHRFFEDHLESCPHDTCALPPTATTPPPTTLNHTSRQRTQCNQCNRRFEDGTRYCYVDGSPLIHDSDHDATHAPTFKICRTCGQEAPLTLSTCPHDNTELTLVNPGNITPITPTIPLLICSKCQQYAMPDTTFCPNDGELLTPLIDARFTALPANGFGPRRKLCRKCGTRYSDACTFCSQDGTPLTHIH